MRGEGDRQGALDAGRAAGQPGSRAARDDRDAVLAARAAAARAPGPSSSGRRPRAAGPAWRYGGLVAAVGLAVGRRRSASPQVRAGWRGAGRDRRLDGAVGAASGRIGRAATRHGAPSAVDGSRRTYGSIAMPGSARCVVAWPPRVLALAVLARLPRRRDDRRIRGRRRSAARRRPARSLVGRPRRPAPRRPPRRATDSAAGVPGRVDRTSVEPQRPPTSIDLAVDARRPIDRASAWTRRRRSRNASGARDRPRRAQHDRAAHSARMRLDRVSVDGAHGHRDRQRPDDRRAARRHPRRRRATAIVRVRYARHAAHQPERLELAVHPGQRHRRPVPLAPVGQPAGRPSTARTTATRS